MDEGRTGIMNQGLERLARALIVLVRSLDSVDNEEASKLFEERYVMRKNPHLGKPFTMNSKCIEEV